MNGEVSPSQSAAVLQLLQELEERVQALKSNLSLPAGPSAQESDWVQATRLAERLVAIDPAASQRELLLRLADAADAFAEGSAVYAVDGTRLLPVAADGQDEGWATQELESAGGLVEQAIQSRAVAAWADSAEVFGVPGDLQGFRHGVIVPLVFGEDVLAVLLAVSSQPIAVGAIRLIGLFGTLLLQNQRLLQLAAPAAEPELPASAAAVAMQLAPSESALVEITETLPQPVEEAGFEAVPQPPAESVEDASGRILDVDQVADLKPEELGLSPEEFERLMGQAAVDWRKSEMPSPPPEAPSIELDDSVQLWREAADEGPVEPPRPLLEAQRAGLPEEGPSIDWESLAGSAGEPETMETSHFDSPPSAEVPTAGEVGESVQFWREDAEGVSAQPAPPAEGITELSLSEEETAIDWSSLASPAAAALDTAAVEPIPPEVVAPEVPRRVLSPEEEAAHQEARRFARLLVAEIKLYNEPEVDSGRRGGDLYRRLRADIDRSREMYEKRARPEVKQEADYLHQELVQVLANGDPALLGPDYPGSRLGTV